MINIAVELLATNMVVDWWVTVADLPAKKAICLVLILVTVNGPLIWVSLKRGSFGSELRRRFRKDYIWHDISFHAQNCLKVARLLFCCLVNLKRLVSQIVFVTLFLVCDDNEIFVLWLLLLFLFKRIKFLELASLKRFVVWSHGILSKLVRLLTSWRVLPWVKFGILVRSYSEVWLLWWAAWKSFPFGYTIVHLDVSIAVLGAERYLRQILLSLGRGFFNVLCNDFGYLTLYDWMCFLVMYCFSVCVASRVWLSIIKSPLILNHLVEFHSPIQRPTSQPVLWFAVSHWLVT